MEKYILYIFVINIQYSKTLIIYKRLKLYVSTGLHDDRRLVGEKEVVEFSAYSSRVAGIKEVLARDHMKVQYDGWCINYSCTEHRNTYINTHKYINTDFNLINLL